MTQKSIFGMAVLHISAGHQHSSHTNTTVVDLCGMDNGIDQFRAPFDCKVSAIINEGKYPNNTVVFESTTAVELPIGIFNNVCFRCTHMDDNFLDQLNIYVGRSFKQGETCYYEGTKGLTDGNHIHIEFAIGKYNQMVDAGSGHLRLKTDLDGHSGINNGSCNLYLPQAVFIDPNITKTVKSTDNNSNYYTNQYVWTLTNGITATNYYLSYFGTNISSIRTSLKMVLTGSAARIRTYPVGGQELTLVPNGSSVEILEFGKTPESDGYQWFQGKFNGITGFLQYDPAVMHPEGSVGTNNPNPLIMDLTDSAARIRISQVDKILTTVPQGAKVNLDEFNDAVASDGYRWVRVRYTENSKNYAGWIQYDPAVMRPYTPYGN